MAATKITHFSLGIRSYVVWTRHTCCPPLSPSPPPAALPGRDSTVLTALCLSRGPNHQGRLIRERKGVRREGREGESKRERQHICSLVPPLSHQVSPGVCWFLCFSTPERITKIQDKKYKQQALVSLTEKVLGGAEDSLECLPSARSPGFMIHMDKLIEVAPICNLST